MRLRTGPGSRSRRAENRAAFEIVFKPNREMFYSGADPVTLLDDLRELGRAHITAHADSGTAVDFAGGRALLSLVGDPARHQTAIQAAIKEVFVFVEDECEVRIRLLEDQGVTVALLGSVPAEAFDLFKAECEDHLERIEADALALEKHPESRDNLDSLFRGVHSIKGNAGAVVGTRQ